jgi:hypothetical protein
MHRPFDALSRSIRRRPWLFVATSVLLTVAIGAFAPQAEMEDGVAVENELSAALETIDETFGDPQAVAQIVVTTTDGSDVRSADGLALSRAIQDAIADSEVADTLITEGEQPPVASYLGGAETGLDQAGLDPAELGDEDVRALQDQALDQLPPEVAGLFEGLVAEDDPPSAGLILVFQDADGLDEDGVSELQGSLADVVAGVDVPDGPRGRDLLLRSACSAGPTSVPRSVGCSAPRC